MLLQNVITLRLSALKAVSIALWAVCFYFAIISEINNETDKALTDYAETLILDYLAGETLPEPDGIAGPQYHIANVSAGYAARHSHIRYNDTEAVATAKGRYEQARTIRYIFQTDDGQYRELTVFTPTIDKDGLKQAILYWLIALYAVLLLGMTAVNLWTVRYSMKPLKTLFGWLEAYRIGRDNKPLDNDTGITEFRKLNETVLRSIERSERQYEQQKLFIANASHEMQTPLAVCVNRLEMMLDDESLTEAQMGEIIKTLRTLKSLSATNRSLLLLCKIDNRQFTDNVPVDFKAQIEKLLPDLAAVYGHRRVSVGTDLSVAPVAMMDSSLAGILLGNLLKNAFVHNVSGGEISITATADTLTIANTGSHGALDESKIFESFYHSADKKSSTGLGLALVKAICNLYGFGITYAFRDGRHEFRLTVG